MKKIMKICGILLLTLIITGCGNSNDANFTLSGGIGVIEKSLTNMEQIQDSTLTDAYNLDLTIMDEYVFKQNENGDFYAIIRTSNKAKVKTEMKKYFENVKEFNVSYSPERLSLLENRLEKELGDYLIYIIANDADNIYDNILDTL